MASEVTDPIEYLAEEYRRLEVLAVRAMQQTLAQPEERYWLGIMSRRFLLDADDA